MRAACRILRWIDPDRPQELTDEQSRSVNQHLNVRELVGRRAALKQAGVVPSDPGTSVEGRALGEVARGVGRGEPGPRDRAAALGVQVRPRREDNPGPR